MVEKCSIWGKGWSDTMPDFIVSRAIKKDIISKACLPEERVKRMEKKGLI